MSRNITEYERTTLRRCSDCRQEKPLAGFHARRGLDDRGEARDWEIRCAPCRMIWKHGPSRRDAGDDWLPVDPLRDWLHEKKQHCSWSELERACGTLERILYRVMYQNKGYVSLDLADRICTNAGVMLWELYPDF